MNAPQTAKPHTDSAGLRKFEQLAGQLIPPNTTPTTPTQGRPALQIILILRRLTELVLAGLPR